MITTGSKFLIGSTVLAVVCAVAYGVTQDGVMGTIGLVSAALALAILATANAWSRDSNVFVEDEAAVETCGAAQPAPGRSVWPFAMGLAGTVLVLGLVTYQAVFMIGLVLFLAAGGEWMIQAWAERASAESAHNSAVRERMAGPLEFPLVGAIAAGILVYAFSRVMLWLSKTNTVIAFAVLGGMVLLFGFFFAFRTSVPKKFVAGISAIAVVGIVAGGVAAGVDGQRDIEEHETTAAVGHDGESICLEVEETHADENASQSVANVADVAARVTLSEEDELTFTMSGYTAPDETVMQLPRSNTSNILFVNESSEDRRLTVDLGETEVTAESGATGYVEALACTTLVEEGGEQLLTIRPTVPSEAQGGYRFFVPGVDSAEFELVVP